MGLSKESLRTSGEARGIAPLNPKPPELNIYTHPTKETGLEVRIGEISGMLYREGQKEEKTEQPRKENPRKDGFEPFVNPEPQEKSLFINGYNGNYALQMRLNRKAVERVLEIAHLDGQVYLTSLSSSRSRPEVQGNELAAKRSIFFGEKDGKKEGENPISRVVSTPEGWRIEINDTGIREELAEKEKLSGKELQNAFIHKFNGLTREGLQECIWREKFSSEKDQCFRKKLFASMILPATNSVTLISTLLTTPLIYVAIQFGPVFFGYGIINLLGQKSRREYQDLESLLKMLDPNLKPPASPFRKIDHRWEYFMPQVEVDKVARTFAYLSIKGRKLVKETKQPNKTTQN